jgi:hypothetical protein
MIQYMDWSQYKLLLSRMIASISATLENAAKVFLKILYTRMVLGVRSITSTVEQARLRAPYSI